MHYYKFFEYKSLLVIKQFFTFCKTLVFMDDNSPNSLYGILKYPCSNRNLLIILGENSGEMGNV